MTSTYERASERASEGTPSVQTLGGGGEEGRPVVRLTGDQRNAMISALCRQTFGDVDLTFKIEFI